MTFELSKLKLYQNQLKRSTGSEEKMASVCGLGTFMEENFLKNWEQNSGLLINKKKCYWRYTRWISTSPAVSPDRGALGKKAISELKQIPELADYDDEDIWPEPEIHLITAIGMCLVRCQQIEHY